MDINTYYKYLNVTPSASDEEVSAAYKKMAFQFHPDKNPHRTEWANNAMTKLNIAYSAVMTHRFNDESTVDAGNKKTETRQEPPSAPRKPYKDIIDAEILTKQFINLRETVKDALYRYYQYTLHSIPIREKVANRAVFNKIVFSLRKHYHAIRRLKDKTEDDELIEHFDVFTAMMFHFYRASECLNIIDSYNSQYDVESYRIYHKADEYLNDAGKELFYDRHNRGYFKKEMAYTYTLEAEKIFHANLNIFPDSTWAVETRIKLDYARSLRRYIELFFSES